MKKQATLIRAACLALLISVITSLSLPAQVTITCSGGFPNGSSLGGIAYGNSLYITVGANGNILSSVDGISWSVVKNSTFLNTSYTRVIYANSMFVAITSDGKIVTSPDGTNWTQRTSPTTNYLYDIAWGSNKFMIVGNNNTTLTSPDGITWTAQNIGAGSSDFLGSVVWTGSKFVVGVRDNGTGNSRAFCSANGLSGWTYNYIEQLSRSLNKIAYVNNKFFAFTATTNIYTSTDAVTWTEVINTRLTGSNQVFHAIYDGTKYFFFGSCQEYGYAAVFTSTDGTTFTLQPQKSTIVVQYSAYLNGRYFILGNEGLVSSGDGTNWGFPGGTYNAIATDGTRYVAVGQNTSAEAAVYSSTDWNTWTSQGSIIPKPLNGVTYGNGKFLAVGNVNSSSLSIYAISSDGVTWTNGNTGFGDALRSVAYGNGQYVAVGANGRILYSSNGTSWSSAETGSGYIFYGVSYINSYFIAVGGGTVNGSNTKVKISSDGISWSDVSPSPAIVGQFHSVAYGNGKYVLVGRDNTAGSLKFFSVSTSNITVNNAYSAAATVSTPEGDVGTLGYGGVTFTNSVFTAIANLKVTPFSAYILTSADGSAWTATAANTTSRLRNIIAAGNSFKVVGTIDTKLNVNAGVTLPVRLVNFFLQKRASEIVLNWQTSNEENTGRFEIERSIDGRNFSRIGEKTAMNTPGSHNYSFPDAESISGTRYYRLKMIDNDNKAVYSPVLKATGPGREGTFSLYPNPAMDYTVVSLAAEGLATVKVFSQNGEKVLQQQLRSQTGMLNLSDLKPGVYLVDITQGERRWSGKLIKK